MGPRARNWFQIQGKITTGLHAVIVCGLVLAFYYRLWLPDQILIKRDAFRFFAPFKQYVAERLLAGELPQWFPYESLGRSVIGSTVAGVFHPFTILYLLFPAHDALCLSTLLACLLAGLGTFVLGRALRLSDAGAMIASIAFACSGYVVSMTENIVYLYGICALPLFCAALGKALEANLAWVVAPAVIWATVLLNGDIQTGYYYGFIALLWAMTCTAAPRRQAFVRAVCAGILAGLLAGIQLAPSLAAFLGTERANPVLFQDFVLSWSMHPLRMLTVIASPVTNEINEIDVAHFFFGSQPAGQALIGLWTDSLYVGMPAVGLALVGAWNRRDLRGLVLLGFAALWLALGRYGGLYEAFYHVVPLWSAFRYPEKLMGVVTFAVAILAGVGVDELRNGRGGPLFWLVLAALCAVLWGAFRTEAAVLWVAAHFDAPVTLTREVAGLLAQAFLFSAVAASGLGVIILARGHSRLPETVLLGLLATVVTLDLSRVNQSAYQTGPKEIATLTPALVEALRRHAGTEEAGHFRIFSNPETYISYPTFLQRSLRPLAATSLTLRQALQVELNAEFRVESINVYMPGESVGIATLRDLPTKDFWVHAYARYNTAYFIGLKGHFSAPPFSQAIVTVLPFYELALVKNPIPPKPRAYLSSRPQSAASRADLPGLMANPDFLAGTTDFIEASDQPLPGPDRGGHVMIERYRPEEVRVQVDTPVPAVLILLDAFEWGWRASLESGEELPIMRANALVRAVAVPAGSHHVTFTYQTPLLAAGAWCSVTGVLVCTGLIWRARRACRFAQHLNAQLEGPSRSIRTIESVGNREQV